jgi:two-component system, OmpR family, sensor kinase
VRQGVAGSPPPLDDHPVERLAAQLAHQLGQSVALIEGYAELLADAAGAGPGDAQAREDAIDGMAIGARRLRRFTEDLLDLGRGRAVELSPERLDPGVAAARAADNLRDEPAARQARIEVPTLPAVRADPELCDRLMLHLLRQAAAAGRIGRPHVRLGGELEGEWVRLDVADEGPLVDGDELDRLFEPGSRARGAGPLLGAGVGLVIARRIVERHGGRIWARSGARRGLTVSMTLPAG